MRAHEVPGLVEVFLRHAPEQVRIAHGREDVVRLHAVVAVVGAQLQELRQVAVPGVQVDRYGALAHAQLVHGYGGVVDDADPANHAAGHAGEAADGSAGGPDLAKVHAHAAAIFGYLGEVVDAAVDAREAVRHGVDEAAGELVVGLARVGQRGGGHGDLEAREHVVEALHPAQAIGFLVHGQVQGDTQVHLLRAFQQLVVARTDCVALEQQVKASIGEELVTGVIDEACCVVDLLAGVGGKDIVAVEVLVRKVAQLCVEVDESQALLG